MIPMTKNSILSPSTNVSAEAIPFGSVLAFDFGTKRIGVAIGNTAVCAAQPLETIDTDVTERRFARIAQLIETWQPVL